MSVLVRCRGLRLALGGKPVLCGADLDVEEGESLALLGSSGSGKSTLLRVLTGLEIPEEGEVSVSGQPATAEGSVRIPPHRRGMAMLFQDLALWPNLTVSGNVRLGLSGDSLSPEEFDRRVRETLETCGIAELASRVPGTLSGGQQQRAALARALAMRPRLLLLDEPMGGLDWATKEALLDELARLRRRLGFSLIVVSHDPLEVGRLCDSIAILEEGRIVERKSVGDVVGGCQTLLPAPFVRYLAALSGESGGRQGPGKEGQ